MADPTAVRVGRSVGIRKGAPKEPLVPERALVWIDPTGRNRFGNAIGGDPDHPLVTDPEPGRFHDAVVVMTEQDEI